MKQKISVSVALIMLFNLSSGVFAQTVPGFKTTNGNYFPQLEQYKKPTQPLVLATEEQRQEQEIVSSIGLNPTQYKKEMEQYAKKNNIDINDIDVSASYAAYSKEILKYDSDYKALSKIFNNKKYTEVFYEAKPLIGNNSEVVKYAGKTYNKTAFLHAAIHNLASRTKSGYVKDGVWIWSKNQEEPFTQEHKLSVMKFIYNTILQYGYYPKDRQLLWAFAVKMVENGKKYFDNDTYKADIFPGLANADDRDAARKGKEKRESQATGVSYAISILPVLSSTSQEKAKSAATIYKLSKSVMREDYGTIGIISGSEALIALRTDDSLNKFYVLVTEDLYRSFATEMMMYFFDSFSVEEWANRVGGSFGNGIKNGLGQYHNAIARRFLYIDPKKNSYDTKRLAENADESLKSYFNVVYTDILEDIGKTLGSYSKDKKVAAIIDKLAVRYMSEVSALKQRQGGSAGQLANLPSNTSLTDKSQTAYEREKSLHTSLIVGILATTKQKNGNLTKAAKMIYNGNWWDLNEATQRDKNNIAAKYLGAQKKPFNAQKQKEFSTLTSAKNIGRFMDVFVNAALISKLIVSAPAIAVRIGNFASRISRGFKVVFKAKPVDAKIAVKPAEVRTAPKEPVKVNPAEAKPVEVKPAELNPAEAKPVEVTPIEITPLEMPKVAPKVVEPIKLPVVAEPVAQVVKVAPEVAKTQVAAVAREVKYDILGKYYQRSVAMSVLPFGLEGISKRLGFFLTNRVYLSEQKLAIARAIVDNVCVAIVPEVTSGVISQSELRNLVLSRALARIQESTEFTEAEKADLLRNRTIAQEAPSAEPAQVEQGKVPAHVKAEVIAKQKANKVFKQYKKAFNEGKWEEAYDYINEAIEYDRTNAAYYHERAMIEYYNLDNKAAAIEDMKTASKLNPGNRRYKVVLERWTKEIPEEVKNYMDLYKAAKAEGNNKLAEEYLTKALALDRDAAALYYNGIEPGSKGAEFEAAYKEATYGNWFVEHPQALKDEMNALKLQMSQGQGGTTNIKLDDVSTSKVNKIIKQATEEISYELGEEIAEGAFSEEELKGIVKRRVYNKIKESSEFTAQEKEVLLREQSTAQEPVSPTPAKQNTNVPAEVVAKQKAVKAFKKFQKARRQGKIQEAYDNIQEAIKYDNKNDVYYYERAMLEYYNFDNKAVAIEDMKTAAKLNPDNNRYQAVLDRWTNELDKITQATSKVKSDILAPYNQTPLMASFINMFLPVSVFKEVGKRVNAFLTNRPYLSGAKQAQIRIFVDEAAAELSAEGIHSCDIEDAIKQRVFEKIKESPDFTAEEKKQLISEGQTTAPAAPAEPKSNVNLSMTIRIDRVENVVSGPETINTVVNVVQDAKHTSRAVSINTTGKFPPRVKAEVIARQKAHKHFKQYQKAFRQGKTQDAYDNIQEAIKYDDSNPVYYYERAMLEWYNLGDKELAIKDMQKACQCNPGRSKYKEILDRWTKELKQTSKEPVLTEAQRKQIQKDVKEFELQKQQEAARLEAEQARKAELAKQEEILREEAKQRLQISKEKAAKEAAEQEARRDAMLKEQEKINAKREQQLDISRQQFASEAANSEKIRLQANRESLNRIEQSKARKQAVLARQTAQTDSKVNKDITQKMKSYDINLAEYFKHNTILDARIDIETLEALEIFVKRNGRMPSVLIEDERVLLEWANKVAAKSNNAIATKVKNLMEETYSARNPENTQIVEFVEDFYVKHHTYPTPKDIGMQKYNEIRNLTRRSDPESTLLRTFYKTEKARKLLGTQIRDFAKINGTLPNLTPGLFDLVTLDEYLLGVKAKDIGLSLPDVKINIEPIDMQIRAEQRNNGIVMSAIDFYKKNKFLPEFGDIKNDKEFKLYQDLNSEGFLSSEQANSVQRCKDYIDEYHEYRDGK